VAWITFHKGHQAPLPAIQAYCSETQSIVAVRQSMHPSMGGHARQLSPAPCCGRQRACTPMSGRVLSTSAIHPHLSCALFAPYVLIGDPAVSEPSQHETRRRAARACGTVNIRVNTMMLYITKLLQLMNEDAGVAEYCTRSRNPNILVDAQVTCDHRLRSSGRDRLRP